MTLCWGENTFRALKIAHKNNFNKSVTTVKLGDMRVVMFYIPYRLIL